METLYPAQGMGWLSQHQHQGQGLNLGWDGEPLPAEQPLLGQMDPGTDSV